MTTTSVSLCDIRDLSVSYVLRDGKRVCAVDQLSVAIGPGEIVGILGESGSGKSTLARAILRLLPAAVECAGNIFFGGHELMQMSESRLREIRGREVALIPQDPALALNPVMTAGSQISEVLRSHRPLPARARRESVLQLLSEVGFEHPEQIYGAYPHQLSGGQRQGVAIAQAISCQPAFLIADEPTSELDASSQGGITSLLAEVRRKHGLSMLLISHDPAIVAGLADRVAVIYAGRIVEVGSTAQIFQRPLHPYTQALVQLGRSVQLAKSPAATPPTTHRRFAAIEGDSPDPSNFPSGCRFHPRCPDQMEVCSQRYPLVFLPESARPVSCFKYGE